MAECVQYNKISKETSGSIYLRIKSNEPPIHCRLIGNAIKTAKVYYDKTWVNMTIEDANKLYREHTDIFRFAPRPTYAVIIIDRADDEVKILEFPPTVFRAFSNRYDLTGISPGNKSQGEEWKVKSEGKGKNTTYTAVFIDTIDLTDEEVEQVKEFKAKKDLPDYYPSSSYEKVVKRFCI